MFVEMRSIFVVIVEDIPRKYHIITATGIGNMFSGSFMQDEFFDDVLELTTVELPSSAVTFFILRCIARGLRHILCSICNYCISYLLYNIFLRIIRQYIQAHNGGSGVDEEHNMIAL